MLKRMICMAGAAALVAMGGAYAQAPASGDVKQDTRDIRQDRRDVRQDRRAARMLCALRPEGAAR